MQIFLVNKPLTRSTKMISQSQTRLHYGCLTLKLVLTKYKKHSHTHTHTQICAIQSLPPCFNLWERRLLQTLVPIPDPASPVGSHWCLIIHQRGLKSKTTPNRGLAWHGGCVSCQTHLWDLFLTPLHVCSSLPSSFFSSLAPSHSSSPLLS